ncbi:MAG: hypothetical protein LUD69_08475 [Oscillospiraceae bacterium]|nr:hypothetical protein [Oscillospiraceae bacterium]
MAKDFVAEKGVEALCEWPILLLSQNFSPSALADLISTSLTLQRCGFKLLQRISATKDFVRCRRHSF